MKKNIKYIIFVTMLLTSSVYSEWQQEKFIIAAYELPNIFDINIPESVCKSKLQTAREAGINLFFESHSRITDKWGMDVHKRILNLMYSVDSENFWLLIKDVDIEDANPLDGSYATHGLRFKDNLSTSQRKTMYGYWIKDEPSWRPEMQTLATSVYLRTYLIGQEFLTNSDPDKLGFISLLPFNINAGHDINNHKRFYLNHIPGNGGGDWNRYKDYVLALFNSSGSKVASFDYYQFKIEDGEELWNTYSVAGGPFYYRTLQLFAEQSADTKKNFWITGRTYPSTPWGEEFSINEINIKFSAFAPLTYGAKGIIWYNYAASGENEPAMLDAFDVPTDSYNWVKKVNKRLEKLGPLLLSMNWQGTYHGGTSDFDSSEPLSIPGNTTCGDPTRTTLPSPHTILSTISSDRFVVGSFTKDAEHYLLVFNKDRANSNDLTLTFRKPVNMWCFSEEEEEWTEIAKCISKYNFNNIGPADIRLIKLQPNMAPINKLLLLKKR